LEYFLFAGYLILFAWLVTKVKFFTGSGLSAAQLVIVFLLKVMAGILYGWIGIYYGNFARMVDTWQFHYFGLQENQLLYSNPTEYFTNLFHNPYSEGYSKFLLTDQSYWNDLKSNAIIKLLSVFDIFSFGNYYVNIIFYSFITMWGPIGLYRVMKDVFPGRKIQLGIAIFLLPSFLYWTSGIHKEGLIFTGISLVIYNVYFGIKEKRVSLKRILQTALGLLLILIFRNFILAIIVPALVVWIVASRFPGKELRVYTLFYISFSILFFTARYINPNLDFPKAVAIKQQQFMQLTGNSMVPVKEVEPTAIGFLKAMPQAFTLSIIRPYPGDVKHILSLAAAIEINFLLLLFVIFLFQRTGNGLRNKNFIYFCLFFAFTELLSIGYTVNFLGAIVRYRSIVLPLLVIPMIALIDWKKTANLLFSAENSNTEDQAG